MVDISDKIPPPAVAVLQAIHNAAQEAGIPFFVIGAAARDMLLQYAYGFPVRRATRDIDIAIRVATWAEYQKLVDTLTSSGEFTPTKRSHRLIFRGSETVDVIPFGSIAGDTQSIAWPPAGDPVMGVLGFEEAFRAAMNVTVSRDPRLDIPVSTLAGLAIMKLISWDEAYPGRRRDGEDFYYIAENYLDAGNDDRLNDEASDLLGVELFDRAVAGARLLGRDMGQLAVGESRLKLVEALTRESDPTGALKLISDIVGTNITLQDKFDEVLGLISSVRMGILDRPK